MRIMATKKRPAASTIARAQDIRCSGCSCVRSCCMDCNPFPAFSAALSGPYACPEERQGRAAGCRSYHAKPAAPGNVQPPTGANYTPAQSGNHDNLPYHRRMYCAEIVKCPGRREGKAIDARWTYIISRECI